MTKKAQSKARPTKRDAILDAALELVVEGGFHSAPLSAISKRANASPGVIYHHFAGKEEIFQAIYERARITKRGSILLGYQESMDGEEAFLLVALNTYAFYRKHHKDVRFVHLYEDAGFPIPDSALTPTPEVSQFQRRFCATSQGGILADLPKEIMDEMTFGLLSRLAKLPRRIPEAVLRDIAQRVWASIKA